MSITLGMSIHPLPCVIKDIIDAEIIIHVRVVITRIVGASVTVLTGG
jgi:hypothetical protein